MQDGVLHAIERRAPALAATLRKPAFHRDPAAEPAQGSPARIHLDADVHRRMEALFWIMNGFEMDGTPYALISYDRFSYTVKEKTSLIQGVQDGHFYGLTLELARTAHPIKTLFIRYNAEDGPCRFLVCTAACEEIDKAGKKEIARKMEALTGRKSYYAKRVVGAFGPRTDNDTLARELGVVYGVLGPVLSFEKRANLDCVLFTSAALSQGLSEVPVSRLHGFVVDSRNLFDALAHIDPGKYRAF